MTIDERLEKLTERHEALAQSMELTHRDIQQLLETTRLHSEQLKTDAEHIRAVVRIAEIHEHRLSDLEGQQ
jgi:archaellum component FlaC